MLVNINKGVSIIGLDVHVHVHCISYHAKAQVNTAPIFTDIHVHCTCIYVHVHVLTNSTKCGNMNSGYEDIQTLLTAAYIA